MPAQDGTGPDGRGPVTGRGMGPCPGAPMRRGFCRGFGRGSGRGFGRGFGWRSWGVQPAPQQETRAVLEQEIVALEQDQRDITAEIETLKKRLAEKRED